MEWPNDICPRCGAPWALCQCKHKPKGFTIVEVVVTIIIICVLLALLIPAVNMARKQAAIVSVTQAAITTHSNVQILSETSLRYTTIYTVRIDNHKYIIVYKPEAVAICPAIESAENHEL